MVAKAQGAISVIYRTLCHRTVSTNATKATTPPALDSPLYWKTFYKGRGDSSSPFDWFIDDEMVIRDIAKHVRSLNPSKVLHIGAGTSSLCEALHQSLGRTAFLLHTDLDETAIEILRKRCALDEKHQVRVDNCLDMKVGTGWDVVLDKGVVDCFVHSDNDAALKTALKNVRSVLSPGGVFIMITNDCAETREGDFDRLGLTREWDVARMKSVELVGEDEGFACTMFSIRPREN